MPICLNRVKFAVEEGLKLHLHSDHRMSHIAYRQKYPLMLDSHRCLLCGADMDHLYHSIIAHLNGYHVEYNLAKYYFETVKKQPVPSSGQDGEGNQKNLPQRASDPTPPESTKPCVIPLKVRVRESMQFALRKFLGYCDFFLTVRTLYATVRSKMTGLTNYFSLGLCTTAEKHATDCCDMSRSDGRELCKRQ